MTPFIGKITIQPVGDRWQASAPVLDPTLAKVDGVLGRMQPEGPWIGGTGSTPTAALEAFQTSLARVVMGAMLVGSEDSR